MSVAVVSGEAVGQAIREIIRPLPAWDLVANTNVVLEPGTRIRGCRIRLSAAEDAAGREPYLVEFEVSGRRYHCPLFCFQPRTQTVAEAVSEAV